MFLAESQKLLQQHVKNQQFLTVSLSFLFASSDGGSGRLSGRASSDWLLAGRRRPGPG